MRFEILEKEFDTHRNDNQFLLTNRIEFYDAFFKDSSLSEEKSYEEIIAKYENIGVS